MAYTAKEQQVNTNGRYELFKEDQALGVDGSTVTILRSIGSFSIDELNRQKAQLETEIADINSKIAAIGAL